MSFHFACRQPPVKRSYIKFVSVLLWDRSGAYAFPHTQKVSVSRSTFLHRSNVQWSWCLHNTLSNCQPSLQMVRNVPCRWWWGIHYSPSEMRALKIRRRQKSLGCWTAHQLLPRSLTSKIQGLSWKPLSHATPGVWKGSTTSPRVWRGCHWGG